MLWHRQAIFEPKGYNLPSSAESRIRTQRVSETQSSADWMPADKPTELSRIKLKTWNRQPIPMISKHSAHLTPLPFGIRTWLWRYTYLLLLISMLWHRQATGSKTKIKYTWWFTPVPIKNIHTNPDDVLKEFSTERYRPIDQELSPWECWSVQFSPMSSRHNIVPIVIATIIVPNRNTNTPTPPTKQRN